MAVAQEVACEYSACNLGVQAAGPSGPAMRALGGIIPIPLTAAPSSLGAPNAPSGSGWFHPLLGASSNHAAGFHPGLAADLGRAAARGAAECGDGPTSLPTSEADAADAADAPELQYCRNLRYMLDMLQRQLVLSPPPEPLHANLPPLTEGGLEVGDAASSAVSVVVYIVTPTSKPGGAARSILEAACRS